MANLPTGINAASMSLLLEDPATAAFLAAKVAAIVGAKPDPVDYLEDGHHGGSATSATSSRLGGISIRSGSSRGTGRNRVA